MRSNGIVLRLAAILWLSILPFAPAHSADWQLATATPDAKAFHLVDTASLKREGDIVKAWTKTLFVDAQSASDGEPFQSQRILYYFNCKKSLYSIKSFTNFSGNALDGDIVSSAGRTEAQMTWADVPPDTVAYYMQEFACQKAPRQ